MRSRGEIKELGLIWWFKNDLKKSKAGLTLAELTLAELTLV